MFPPALWSLVCVSFLHCLCGMGVATSFPLLDFHGWHTCCSLLHQSTAVYQSWLRTRSCCFVIYGGCYIRLPFFFFFGRCSTEGCFTKSEVSWAFLGSLDKLGCQIIWAVLVSWTQWHIYCCGHLMWATSLFMIRFQADSISPSLWSQQCPHLVFYC